MARPLVEQCLDLAWSQWGALGVSGSGVLVPQHAVDLEAAIAFAPCLEELEPRLHAEVLDWCSHFARHFTSVSALKQTLSLFDPEHRASFERFAAIVNAQGATKWPTGARPRPFALSGKSVCKIEGSPAVQLRARKIFGINARADILVGLALESASTRPRWTHVTSFLDLGYTKRNLSDALVDLQMGGMLAWMRTGNRIVYTLKKAEPLRSILAPLPETTGQPWGPRLAIAASLIEVDRRTQGKSATTRAVEVRKLFERKRPVLERARIAAPELSIGDPWPELEAWMEPMLRP
ncbi:MAG TPA: hypothetical protein VK932_16600 [Kofleriaceae bacterium]|nr:hypothetical protein [Kofleriaceae bacterium]